ncbi:flavonol synthase/flavanone 3-hydroxylase-like, partial [Trifolium medium]|nr:flavonol synthase/flavanone 3-hydroxylase-like [Trifolium medium]
EAFTNYAKEISSLVTRLLSLISIGLGLEEDFLLKKVGEQPRLRAQANFYPPCSDPELTMGLQEHTDFNALTVLLQSEISGLQVNKDGKWISVPCIPNAFVINLADQIEVCAIDVLFLAIFFTCHWCAFYTIIERILVSSLKTLRSNSYD